jgi:hypothetical protein
VTWAPHKIVSRMTRFVVGMLALSVLTILLAMSWLRTFVPVRGPERLRDRSWLSERRVR